MPLQELNTPSGGWLNIFLDLEFGCATTVQGWEFHATKTGKFFAGVWRKSGTDIMLIGKNEVAASKTGKQTVSVAAGNEICVQPGDVIGIHYSNANEAGVVPYQQSGRNPQISNVELSSLVNSAIPDSDLDLYTAMAATTTSFKRVPALQPVLTTEAACFVDDLPIQELNTPSGGWLNVFMDLTFECTTTVIGWEFHATKAGTFYAGIWRLADGDESQMTLIATNKVTAEEEGKQTADVEVDDQICVKPGDILGIHYDDTDAAGVVSYEQTGRTGTAGLSADDFSALVNKKIGGDDVQVGKTMSTSTVSFKRVPALTPILSNGPEDDDSGEAD